MSKNSSGGGSQQFKNLRYEEGEKPAFLKRMLGQQDLADDGRPSIPRRPDGDSYEDTPTPERDEEGDEAPQVVVLKEGKHMSKAEVDAFKGVASTEEATTPLPVQQPVEAPKTASIGMTFSSAGPTSTKRKLQQEAEEAKKKAKKDEARSSKPKAKKRKGPLSFRDE